MQSAHWATPDDPLPEDFSFQLYPGCPGAVWSCKSTDSMERVPLLAEAGMSKVINGPIPYAPDGQSR